MIDIFIRTSEAPASGILGEVFFHVFVDEFLKVEAFITKGTDDDIGADSTGLWDIATRIFQGDVGGVVGSGDSDLGASGFGEFFAFGRGGGGFVAAGEKG